MKNAIEFIINVTEGPEQCFSRYGLPTIESPGEPMVNADP